MRKPRRRYRPSPHIGRSDVGPILTEQEARYLKHYATLEKHWICIVLAFWCGLKVGEIGKLKVQHVPEKRGLLRVPGRRGGEFPILEDFALREIRSYIRKNDLFEWLIPGREAAKPLSQRAIQMQISKIGERAGLPFPTTAGALRDCYAVRQLRAGVAVEQVERMMGLKPRGLESHIAFLREEEELRPLAVADPDSLEMEPSPEGGDNDLEEPAGPVR